MPFSIFLTDETTRTSTSECEDVDTESHNIKHEENCQNCVKDQRTSKAKSKGNKSGVGQNSTYFLHPEVT